MKIHTLVAVILAAAACGGEPDAGAGETAPPAASAPAETAGTATAPAAPSAAPARQAATRDGAAPNAADSAAAAREDVSPEWKRNSRAMAPYASCMEQAGSAPPSARGDLEAACGRLPTAPR